MGKMKKVAKGIGLTAGFVTSVVVASQLGRVYGRCEGVYVTKLLLQEKFPETHDAICKLMDERNS